jgi:hypothetical protein
LLRFTQCLIGPRYPDGFQPTWQSLFSSLAAYKVFLILVGGKVSPFGMWNYTFYDL